MKLTSIAVASFLASLATAQSPRYKLTDLGPVGPDPAGGPYVLRSNGLISGGAPVRNGAVHAVFWYKGIGPIDLGTPGLGGARSNSIAYGVNDWGQFAGQAETSTDDAEDFCAFKAPGLSTGKVCLPFLWQTGVMTALPTLGGKNGYATTINNRGVTGGLSETTTPDPDPECPVHQFKPVVWQNGKVQPLATSGVDPHGLPFNDRNGFVYGINDSRQTVGASGDCSPFITASATYAQPLHALLWESDGTVHDLGNLGGTGHGAGIWAISINNQGHVVGASDLKGDESSHAFLWTKETDMQDLGTLPGDDVSGALWVNDGDDIVGVSISFNGGFNPRAFLRQKGAAALTDLNTLIPANSRFHLLFGSAIDTRGEIIATAFDNADEQVHSVLLTPTHGASASQSDAPENVVGPVLPEHVREVLRRRLGYGKVR